MQTTILVLHILVCVVLIILVLLQSGRDGMGVIFGGGGNSSVFGSQGAGGILSKLTAFLAALFIVTSLGYNIMFSSNSNNSKSVLDVQFENVSTDQAPLAPAPVSTNATQTSAPTSTETSAPDQTKSVPAESVPATDEIPAPTTETDSTETKSDESAQEAKPAE